MFIIMSVYITLSYMYNLIYSLRVSIVQETDAKDKKLDNRVNVYYSFKSFLKKLLYV